VHHRFTSIDMSIDQNIIILWITHSSSMHLLLFLIFDSITRIYRLHVDDQQINFPHFQQKCNEQNTYWFVDWCAEAYRLYVTSRIFLYSERIPSIDSRWFSMIDVNVLLPLNLRTNTMTPMIVSLFQSSFYIVNTYEHESMCQFHLFFK
jgi:hypothetical protein